MAHVGSTAIKGHTPRRSRAAMTRVASVSSRGVETVALFLLVCVMWGLLAAVALQVAAR